MCIHNSDTLKQFWTFECIALKKADECNMAREHGFIYNT